MATLSARLAEQGYNGELGARSITDTVEQEIRKPLIGKYLDAREEIREDQPTGRFVAGVDAASGEIEVSQFPMELTG